MSPKIDYNLLSKHKRILASDEVGRGCLAGDVITCSILINNSEKNILLIKELESIVKDSKKLSPKKRQMVLEEINIEISDLQENKIIEYNNFSIYIGSKTPEYIDENNILKSTMDCFEDSYNSFRNERSSFYWIIDGDKKPKDLKNTANIETIVKGDQKSILIGLASIIAKEYRDHKISLLDDQYPEYKFKQHKGYGTKLHYEVLKKYGVIEGVHRKSFLKKIL